MARNKSSSQIRKRSGVGNFKVLMRKNFIAFRRQIIGSLCELLCPAVLMLLLLQLRGVMVRKTQIIERVQIQNETLVHYPTATLDLDTDRWSNSNRDIQAQAASLLPFLNFSSYPRLTQSDNGTFYDPLLDVRGPYSFYPYHCEQQYDGTGETPNGLFNLIAVVKNDNQIQADLITQLQLLMAKQEMLSLYRKNVFNAANNNVTTGNATHNHSQTIFSRTNYTLSDFKIMEFDNKNQLFDFVTSDDDLESRVCFGFQVIEHSSNNYELELFLNDRENEGGSIPDQSRPAYDEIQTFPRGMYLARYALYGTNYLQNWVANTILRRKSQVQGAEIASQSLPMNLGEIEIDHFTPLMMEMFSFIIFVMFIPLMYRSVFRIVSEKSTNLKESLKMMGMNEVPYWASWWTYFTLMNSVMVTLTVPVLGFGIFEWAWIPTLWLVCWTFGQSLLGLVMITQSIFSTPRAAAVATTAIYFGLSIPDGFIGYGTARNIKLAVCFCFPQVTMIQTVKTFIANERAVGVGHDMWDEEFEGFSIRDGLILLTVSGLILVLLGCYMEAVMPKNFGKSKSLCFCLRCSSRNRRTALDLASDYNHECQVDYSFETKYLNRQNFEPAEADKYGQLSRNLTLHISDLKKTYDNGFKAVKGVNLRVFSDQIFVLLGHNGAGKTTTISMLTGLLDRSEGSAKAFGVDLFNNMDDVRQFMGVCPQHDVLFELLTVEENLSVFYEIKGGSQAFGAKQQEIDQIISDVGLCDHRVTVAQNLSGGNKRKLSVAIALIAGSKFILLDEPTSGLDLEARRKIWTMLKKHKQGKIVILTTHYMDEADILGDRIGIMANGKMTCLGSSLFLKKKFGLGYNLDILMRPKQQITQLLRFLHQGLGPDVQLISQISCEIKIQVPKHYAMCFSEFFSAFESAKRQLGFESYNLSSSTLEEVFLRIGHLEDPTSINQASSKVPGNKLREPLVQRGEQTFILGRDQAQLDDSLLTSLKAVFYKRVITYKWNTKAIMNEVFIPTAIMCIGILVVSNMRMTQSPSRLQTPHRLPLPQTLVLNEQPIDGDLATSNVTGNLPVVPEEETTFKLKFTTTTKDATLYDFQVIVNDVGRQSDSLPYMYGSYYLYEADKTSQQYKFINLVNNTAQDAAVLNPQFMYEAILRTATEDPEFQFSLRLTPLPPTPVQANQLDEESLIFLVFILAISYSVAATGMVGYLVVERSSGLLHFQEVTGMKTLAFWLANFTVDWLKLQPLILATLACFFVLKFEIVSAYITFLVFPFGLLPFTYVTSFLFSSESSAQTFTMFFNFLVIGVLSPLNLNLRMDEYADIGDDFHRKSKIFPSYGIASSLICDLSCKSLADQRKKLNLQAQQLNGDPWHISNNLTDFILQLVFFVFWSSILFAIEASLFQKVCKMLNCRRTAISNEKCTRTVLDSDVVAEQDRVKSMVTQEQNPSSIAMVDFRKVYRVNHKLGCGGAKHFVAVEKLSFAIDQGECFCLLGVNGAGKSTTFKSLTRQVEPTSGQIFIAGSDINSFFNSIKRMIGYCPQQNLIFDFMSVEEHLYYFASIKGIPYHLRETLVNEIIEELNLQPHRYKAAGTLSGGWKRKLALAQATMGNPPVILLDEPSAGMDPESRRDMWDIIRRILKKGLSAVVLTTHSIEEAEALSTKIGIMVRGGVFKCFGSASHIRNKFGKGYIIEIKIKTPRDRDLPKYTSPFLTAGSSKVSNLSKLPYDESVKEFMRKTLSEVDQPELSLHTYLQIEFHYCITVLLRTFTHVDVLEQYGSYMCVRVDREVPLGQVFAIVQGLDLASYSVGQTSLEQIFQSFANPDFETKKRRYTLQEKDNQKKLSLIQ